MLTLINGDGAGLRPAHHFNDVLVTTTRLIQYVEKGQIEVAHLLLRRWRRVPLAETAAKTAGVAGEARTRIRQIIAAREAMLVRIHARFRRHFERDRIGGGPAFRISPY